MTAELSWESVLAWRVARQGLAERAAADDWAAVVGRVCGLHAQVQAAAELTLWTRGRARVRLGVERGRGRARPRATATARGVSARERRVD